MSRTESVVLGYLDVTRRIATPNTPIHGPGRIAAEMRRRLQ